MGATAFGVVGEGGGGRLVFQGHDGRRGFLHGREEGPDAHEAFHLDQGPHPSHSHPHQHMEGVTSAAPPSTPNSPTSPRHYRCLTLSQPTSPNATGKQVRVSCTRTWVMDATQKGGFVRS